MDASGFVPLPVLLQELRSPGVTEAIVRHIVATDSKGRYEILDGSPPCIRAVQGHSVQLAAPHLTPVTAAEDVPFAVHITSQENWAAIQVQHGSIKRRGATRSRGSSALGPTFETTHRACAPLPSRCRPLGSCAA
jgi:RNA:NAD 2'-phosphotransferase (TPT1/KptA family)